MTKIKDDQEGRLRLFFEDAVNNAKYLDANLETLDYYSAICKSACENKLYKMLNCNLCLFKYLYSDGSDSIVLIYGIPSPSNPDSKDDSVHVSQKVMELIKIIENCFITVDYMNLQEVKEDKFLYLTVVKKISEKKEND